LVVQRRIPTARRFDSQQARPVALRPFSMLVDGAGAAQKAPQWQFGDRKPQACIA
jgi:hypothetical protein